MEQGLGWLRWSPDQFWNATLEEVSRGIMGYIETRGGKPEGRLPLPDEDYDRLIAMAQEEMEREAAEAREREAA
jgi:hypothetical protein